MRFRVWVLVLAVFWGCAPVAPVTAPKAVPPVSSVPRPAPGSVEVLFEEGRYTLSADGTKEYLYQIEYLVKSTADLEGWSRVSAAWTPWYQARPELEAIVTAADGSTIQISAEDIKEKPVKTGHPDIRSDRRRLEAALPGLEPGMRVKQTIRHKDTRPFFGPGAWGRYFFGTRAWVRTSRLIIDAPESVDLRYQVRGVELTPEEKTKDGRRILTFQAGALPPVGPTRLHLPFEQPRFPYVVFTTVDSWAGLAQRYHEAVEARLKSVDIRSLVRGIAADDSRDRVLSEVLRRLHSNVRYTGRELGEVAIVPSALNEILERRYGDGKDKAVLLVAMLRTLGIEAHLALVRAGFGEDVPLDVPGVRAFNHVVAYLPGKVPMFVDATAETMPVGGLPPEIRGRQALVAMPETTGLVTIAEAKASDNRYVENREVRFSRHGPVSVLEESAGWGALGQKIRGQLGRAPQKALQASLARYAKSSYREASLGGFRADSAFSARDPYRVELEVLDSNIGFTGMDEARLQLPNAVLFGWLPEHLRNAALGLGTGSPTAKQQAASVLLAGRTDDLVLPEPHVAELRYKVHPPEGYVIRALPEPVDVSLGGGRYQIEARSESEDVIEVTFRFDTGPRRMTAEAAQAFVRGLREVWESKVLVLRFDHRAALALSKGDVKVAIDGYRALAEAHPEDAIHHARYAGALLEVGLAEAARGAAHRAVEIDPDSTIARLILGFVLEHDAFGRRFASGYARKQALAAYEVVLSRQPDHHEARLRRAGLLERDAAGRRYAAQANLDQAIEEYLEVRRATGTTKNDGSIMLAMFWAKDFTRLARFADGLSPSVPRDAFLLIVDALQRGMPTAVNRAQGWQRPAADLRQTWGSGARLLASLRRYDLAHAFSKRALLGAEDPAKAQASVTLLGKLRRTEDLGLSDRDPIGVVRSLLSVLLDENLDEKALLKLLSRRARKGQSLDAQLERLRSTSRSFQASARRAGTPLSVLRDEILSLTEFHIEGNDRTGYRLRSTLARKEGVRETWWFVVKESGRYRVRAAQNTVYGLGEEALWRLRQGKTKVAKQWLDWARELVRDKPSEDPLGRLPFAALWPGGASKAEIRAAAAALAAMGPKASSMVAILGRELKRVEDTDRQTHLEHAQYLALRGAEQNSAALSVAERMMKRHPKSNRAQFARASALMAMERYETVIEIAGQRQAENPDDQMALNLLTEVALQREDIEQARAYMRRSIDLGFGTSTTYNNLAWLALFTAEVTDRDIDLALESNNRTRFESPTGLHTLAALYATTGRPRKAFQLFLKRQELLGISEPETVDWYLIGLILQHYEFTELAVQAFQRVLPEGREADSTHRLAQMRLADLRRASE